ncbi:MAG: lysyl-tRNA synthetase, class [Actinomycetota bacterium]|nr:lysyl-tRNA synthetase, class [Actinomycetota bacterium]
MSESAYPYRYERTATVLSLRDRFDDLQSGTDSGLPARIAGRLQTIRSHGKVAFADISDGTGKLQLFAQPEGLGEDGFESFAALGVGDIVGASGEIVKTRRGELSLRVDEVVLLAKCLRPMPEKWHGMSDVEARYRQRYLDLLVNPQARRAVDARSAATAAIRRFMVERGFVEVETPLLQPIAGGAVARPFVTHHNALDIDLYLRVAPELYLKRLLIGGYDRVFELNRSFRNEGVSTKHNPEFTMLEGYEAYSDYEDTMELVEALVKTIAETVSSFTENDPVIDMDSSFDRITMLDAIGAAVGEDITDAWSRQDFAAIESAARAAGVGFDKDAAPGKVIAAIYEQRVEKEIDEPTFVIGFPKEISPLAKDHRTIPGFTEHADLVIHGVEIAPIYSELNDPVEQRRRFEQQAADRARGDLEAAVPDEDFLEAMAYGMPPAGGFGLGIDRLLMQLLGVASIREVILFPTLKPEPGR